MKKNTKVMRLDEKEVKMIDFLREVGSDKLIENLKIIKNLDVIKQEKELQDTIKQFLFLFGEEDLQKEQVNVLENITKEELSIIKNAIDKNISIIITGEIGVGKTVLLKTLLKYEMTYFADRSFLIVDSAIPELKPTATMTNKNLLYRNIEKLTIQDIKNVLLNQESRMVLSEMNSDEEILTAISGLSSKASLLTTMHNDNLKEKLKTYSNLTDIPFIIVQLGDNRECLDSNLKRTIRCVYTDKL